MLIADLIRQNIEQNPKKAERLAVPPHVTITADSESILDLARLSIHRLTGLPVLWDQMGRSFLQRICQKRVRIVPFGRHLGKLSRLLAVMSVSSWLP